MQRLLRPWRRLVNRCELGWARAMLVRRRSPSAWMFDETRSYRLSLDETGRTLYLIVGRGSSEPAVRQFESQILPGATRQPGQWVFLLEHSGWGSDVPAPSQYSVAAHVARRLHIPVLEDPFIPSTSELVIDEAVKCDLSKGATREDLYAALCYDYLPRPWTGNTAGSGLRLGEIHGVLHPRWEALRIRRELHWEIELECLVGIVEHLLDRIGHDRPAALDDFYEQRLRTILRDRAARMNRSRLNGILAGYPTRRLVLAMIDEIDLPVILPGWPRTP